METLDSLQESIPPPTPQTFKEQIGFRINRLRLNPKNFIERIKKKIEENRNFDKKTINFPDLQKTIFYSEDKIMENFISFLDSSLQTNLFLADFIICSSETKWFQDLFLKKIYKEKKIGFYSENIVLEILQKKFPSNNYCGYFIEKIPISKIEDFIIFIIIEEFLCYNDEEIYNLTIETNNKYIRETIPFISNVFSGMAVFELKNENELADVYLLLYEKDYLEIIRMQSKTSEIKIEKIETEALYIQRRYEHISNSHLQIPLKTVHELIQKMDFDNDGKVSLQDIKQFTKKNCIDYSDEFIETLFKDASSYRSKPSSSPLTPFEIHSILRLTKYKDPSSPSLLERGKKFRDVWLTFLEKINIKMPRRKNLPDLKMLRPILTPQKKGGQRVVEFYSEGRTKIKNLKEKYIPRSMYEPEAGVVVNNTKLIREIVYDDNDYFNMHPFQFRINKELIKERQGWQYECIGFHTKRYFDEALKLSKLKEFPSEKNPILTFVPESAAIDEKVFKRNSVMNFFEELKSRKSTIRDPFEDLESYHDDFVYETKKEESDKSSQKKNKTSKKSDWFPCGKPEDCNHLKIKLAKLESKSEKYSNPKGKFSFRDEFLDQKKPLYKIRFKCDSIENPYNMSMHDQRPKELLLKEVMETQKQLNIEKERINSIISDNKKQPWRVYFRRANLARKEGFLSMQRPEFLEKDEYSSPDNIMLNLLRTEVYYENDFKRYMKQLHTTDNNKFL